jgi:hypothetical protein
VGWFLAREESHRGIRSSKGFVRVATFQSRHRAPRAAARDAATAARDVATAGGLPPPCPHRSYRPEISLALLPKPLPGLADGVIQRRLAPTAKSDRCRCRRGRASEYKHRRLVASTDFVKVP